MRFKLLIFLLCCFLQLQGQDDKVYLIDPIVEVPDNQMMSRFFASDQKDWGWAMMNPQIYFNAGYTGKGTVFFVIDTGIESEHEDLKGKVIGRKNFTADKTVENGHGTWCASRIASPENGFGVVGIAPGAVLYDLQVLDGSGSGSTSNVAAAYRYAADVQLPAPYNKWKRVTTASLGSPSRSLELEEALKYANSKGVLNFCAAGNSYKEGQNTVNCPGCFSDYSITVAANDQQKQPAYFSSAGPEVDITAPGVSLNGAWTGNSYRLSSGTSMATPAAAAAFALFAEKNPQLSGQVLVEAFYKEYATDIHAQGFDIRTGHGLVALEKYFNVQPPSKDTQPDEPQPEKTYKSRVVSIPIRASFDNILFKSQGDGVFRLLSIGGIVVEYKTSESASIAYTRINEATNQFFANRGFILPDNQADMDFAFGWAAFFYRMILKNQGFDVTISEAWVAEGQTNDRTLIYYTKAYPIGKVGSLEKMVNSLKAKRLVRKQEARTLIW